MIKNIFNILLGMYIGQEYNKLVPNIKNHISYINILIDSNNNKNKSNYIINKCPIIKYVLKK